MAGRLATSRSSRMLAFCDSMSGSISRLAHGCQVLCFAIPMVCNRSIHADGIAGAFQGCCRAIGGCHHRYICPDIGCGKRAFLELANGSVQYGPPRADKADALGRCGVMSDGGGWGEGAKVKSPGA